jgi:signal transduction histidine kinase
LVKLVKPATALAEFLSSERDALLERWVERAERFTLGANAPDVLHELERALCGRPSPARLRELVARSRTGPEALRELTLLRGAVLELIRERELRLEAAEAATLHQAIDEILLAFAERASERLAQELELRDRFVSVLGHDLRNPISAIKLGSSMLLRDTQSAEARHRTAERIVSSSNRMLRILEDLLDFMRLRPGALPELELAPISLAELCSDVVSECLASHPRRTITFASEQDVRGQFDRRRLGQALAHVIASALEHSPQGSEVRVSLARDAGACIKVRHGGPVIPQHELGTIFDPSQRGELVKSSERPSRGLGLGLYLADQIVRAHGGRIEAESNSSTGTTFSLLLPSSSKD